MDKVNEAKKAVEDAMKSNDMESIKSATEQLKSAWRG